MMNFKFYYDDLDLLEVDAVGKHKLIAWVLTDNNHSNAIDELLNAIIVIQNNGGEWDMSFNKSYVNINKDRVQCGNLLHEEKFIEISHEKFSNILKKWKSFTSKKGSQRELFITI
jgi:hypothetical protein